MRDTIRIAGRVALDSTWRPLLMVLRAGRLAYTVILLLGLTVYLAVAQSWAVGLSGPTWAAVAGWVLAGLFFARACQLQASIDRSGAQMELIKDRQATIDKLDALRKHGEAYLHFRVTEPSGAVEKSMWPWIIEVREFLVEKFGQARGMEFSNATAYASPLLVPGCPAERAKQIRELQGKVDYLEELSKRLVEMGPPRDESK